MFAAGGGHNDSTRLLLEHKADVNVVVMAKPEYIEQVAKSKWDSPKDSFAQGCLKQFRQGEEG